MADSDKLQSGMSFNLDDFANQMAGVKIAAQRTITAAEKQQELNLAVADKARTLAGGYSAIVSEEAARQAAILKQQAALPISAGGTGLGGNGRQNPLDLLSGAAAAILDPDNFTAAGLQKQLAMSENRVQLAGTIHDAESNRLTADAAFETARLGADSVALELSLTNMKAQVEARQTYIAGVQANEIARTTRIAAMDASEISHLLTTAKSADPSSKIDLQGGFAATRQELLLRQRELKQQELLLTIPIEATSPEAANHATLLLGTMSHADLLKVRENGNVLPNGYTVPTAVLDAEIQSKGVHSVEKVLATQSSMLVDSTQERVSNLVQRNKSAALTPSSPLYGAAKKLEARAAGYQVLYEQAIKLGTPEAIQAAVLAGQEVENIWNSEVESVAKSRAGVDKALVPLLTAQLKGEQVDPSQVLDYMVGRVSEGMPFNRAFQDQKTATRLQVEIEAEIKSRLAIDGGNRKEVAPIATQKVLESFVNDSAFSVTSSLFTESMNRSDNPLRLVGLPPAALANIESLASSTAQQYVIGSYNINSDQAAILFDSSRKDENEIAAATGIELATVQAIRRETNQASLAALVTQIDAITAGKTSGRAYVDWLSQNWQTIAEKSNIDKNGNNAFMTLDAALANSGSMIQMLNQAVEQADGMGEKIISDFYTQHNNPRLMFTSSINGLEMLTEEQRAAVVERAIIPALDIAEKQKLNPEQTTTLVMSALDGKVQQIPLDPATSKSASIAASQLPQVISATRHVLRSMERGVPADKPSRQAMLSSLQVLRTGATPTAMQQTWALGETELANAADESWLSKYKAGFDFSKEGRARNFAADPMTQQYMRSQKGLSEPGAVEALRDAIEQSIRGME